MKIALLGAGKTGKKVLDLHQMTTVFNTTNPPTKEQIKEYDVVISFLPGEAFVEYIPMLIESRVPVVTGSTGFSWNEQITNTLKENNLKWINSHNFSLGMNLVKSMIETMSKAEILFNDAEFNIHDRHHIHKVDSPSGTALSWKDWLGHEVNITAERVGDVIGYHHIEMHTPVESIKIVHEAKDRAIFARGALWAADKVVHDSSVEHGLTHFSELVKKHLNI